MGNYSYANFRLTEWDEAFSRYLFLAFRTQKGIWCRTGTVDFCRRQNRKSWSAEENAEPEAGKRPSTWQWKIRLVLFYLVWWGKNSWNSGRRREGVKFLHNIVMRSWKRRWGFFFPLYGIFSQWSAALAISHTSVKSRWTVSRGNTSMVFFHTRKPGHPGNLQLGRQIKNRK